MKQLLFLLIIPMPLIFGHRCENRFYHQLQWCDFWAKRPAGDVITAAQLCTDITWGTSSHWDPDWHIPIDVDTVTSFEASPYMHPEESFTTTHDPYILKHEQGHFDICLIECRKINKIAKLNKHYLSTTWEIFRDSCVKIWNKKDSIYDQETNHSQNRSEQEKWNRWIREQLKK